jgi:D-serine deaminase-like pyridoxal phosphate-dependent protein
MTAPRAPILAPLDLPPLPERLDTPAVVVFVERVDANIDRLQSALDRRGIRLRPHVKTHKSVRIARRQLDAGATGLTVGTLGEAEAFAAAGVDDLFLAYPLWAEGPKGERLRSLLATVDLIVGADSVEGVERLATAVATAGRRAPLRLRIEVDSGAHRTGVSSPAAAVEVARAARDRGFAVDGIFTHGGHSYRPGAAIAAGLDEVSALEQTAAALEADGVEVPAISAGSTPTMLEAAAGRVNEIRAGTYVLGDRQQWALGAIEADGLAAVVASTVVSASADRVVLDAGAKALTKDRADWLEGFGLLAAYPEAVIERLYDYHAVVRVTPGVRGPRLGEVVAVVPNHVCPVIDLVSSFVAVGRDGRAEYWPVDARGRSG